MTTDTRTETERAYDSLKDGSAYTKPQELKVWIDQQLEDETAIATWIDALPAAHPCEEKDGSHSNILLGHIDGYPVLAHYMPDDPDEGGGALGWAKMAWNGIEIGTDGDSYLNLPMDGCFGGDMKPAEWQTVKALAQTDVCERLMALALRYPRFADVPPAAPAVRTACWYRDPNNGNDLTEEPCGPLNWIDYVCDVGNVYTRISFNVERPHELSTSFAGHPDIDLNSIEQAMVNMQTLLADPRVKAAREAA